MNYWNHRATLPWESPITFAGRYASGEMAFLYSGLVQQGKSRRSFLFLSPQETYESARWDPMPPCGDSHESLPVWVGYFGYHMRENAQRSTSSFLTFPAMRWVRYRALYVFDHAAQRVAYYSTKDMHDIPPQSPNHAITQSPRVHSLRSNFTRAEYESAIVRTKEEIHAGNFYQANLTRKFFGTFECTPNACDYWNIFAQLAQASAAQYSAYIQHSNSAIISSSPECFLTIDTTGRMVSRPIKGTVRRGATPQDDAQRQEHLRTSAKNQAENLMIVDLVRHDLAQVSVPQSVTVTEQAQLYSYQTLHHLISTVEATKRPEITISEAIRTCFPPGSMTGAPKRAAIRWCEEIERMERGIYSGAIGWLSAHACDLSVVIRTLLIQGDRFEFQVGGGIVADSDPADEWHETLTKAKGILDALGIAESQLAAL